LDNDVEDFDSRAEELVEKVAEQLVARGWRMVTAESCSGGWIAKCCTDRAGSSRWFDRGLVVYSYRAKEELLGVSHEDLVEYGAVSQEIAAQMAAGAVRNSGAAVSVAATGIAGPGGGMPGNRRARWRHAGQARGPGLFRLVCWR
jgi:nicotinamide-nucleotide amidase